MDIQGAPKQKSNLEKEQSQKTYFPISVVQGYNQGGMEIA